MSRFVVLPRVLHFTVLAGLLLFAGCDAETDPLTAPKPEMVSPVGPIEPMNLLFQAPVCDDAGPNDVPEQSDLNCFTRADDEVGVLGIRWWWDDTNVWTGSGQSGDACGLVDTDSDTFANLAVCARFTNNAAGTQVIQLPSAGTALVYECSDKKNDRCTKQVTLLTAAQIGTTTCSVALGTEPPSPAKEWQGDDHPADVEATCRLDLVALGISSTNLLNTCSYPSGSPNSNPFDCVITPGAGYLRIHKTTSPASTGDFGFTLSPAAPSGSSSFNVPGDDGLGGPGSSALIPVDPTRTYSLTETVPSGWSLLSASCSPSTGTFNSTTKAITGISVAEGQTVTCTFSNSLPPGITVTKTADPTTLPETGGSVEFSLVVANTSAGALTLNSLSDDVFGNVADGSNAAITSTDCSVPQALAAAGQTGASYSCKFTAALGAGVPGTFHLDTVTASASNAAGTATAKDSAKVTYTDVAPTLTVVKSASPGSVPETGGSVTFSVAVTNTSSEPVTLTSLVDDVFGSLDGKGNCSVPQSLAASGQAGASYGCSFSQTVSGNFGTLHIDTVTASIVDDDATTATAQDSAKVTFNDVLPDITVTKTVSPTTLQAGGVNPPPPGPGGGGDDLIYLGWVCDTAGPDDVPAQSDVNCFTRADNQAPDVLGVKWTWDNTNVWTGSGQTGDACALFDTDSPVNNKADVAVCARFTNDPTGTQIIQVPSAGAVIAYVCTDKSGERCSKQTSLITNIGSTMCSITKGSEPGPPAKSWMGNDTPDDVIAECELDLDVLPIPSSASLLNVCSFPSGEPNSNPFDCVITGSAGFLVIEKATTPSSGEGFEFTVSPNPITNNNPYAVAGDDGSGGPGTSVIILVTPGTYTITETLETNWDLISVSCSDGSGTFNGTNAITGVSVAAGETVTCTFTNDWSLTGDVTYTIEVKNNSLEAATLDYLDDDKFGDLDGQGTCSLNQALAPAGQTGDTYTCTFSKSLTGSAGDTHTNTVTARADDDEGNTDEDDDDATVTFVGP